MKHRPDEADPLSALPATGPEHDRFGTFLTSLRAEADQPAVGPLVSEWAAAAAAHTAEAAGRPGWRQRKAGAPAMIWKRRIATALASAVLLVVGFSGLAWAADGSAPGDTLYGVDRALEHVGIGHGGAAERLIEVRSLLDAGDIAGGLSHAGELVGEQPEDVADDPSQAAEALQAAATRIAGQSDEASAEVRGQVAVLLTYLSENVGQVDGRAVAALAREIGGNEDPAGSGPPVSIPPVEPGPPVSVPPVDPPGPPTSVPPVDPPGPPSSVPPDHPGGPPVSLPVEVGPPVEPGPPISLPAQVP